jgi:hypothetical protein
MLSHGKYYRYHTDYQYDNAQPIQEQTSKQTEYHNTNHGTVYDIFFTQDMATKAAAMSKA